MPIDPAKIRSTLVNARIQVTNNALFQTISSIIDYLRACVLSEGEALPGQIAIFTGKKGNRITGSQGTGFVTVVDGFYEVVAGGLGEFLVQRTDFTTAGIQSLGTTRAIIADAPGAGLYLRFHGATFHINVASPFGNVASNSTTIIDYAISAEPINVTTSTEFFLTNPGRNTLNDTVYNRILITDEADGQAITLRIFNNLQGNLSGGSATMIVYCYYTVEALS